MVDTKVGMISHISLSKKIDRRSGCDSGDMHVRELQPDDTVFWSFR